MDIRKQIEKILELHIDGDNWDDVWRAAETQGKMTGSRTNKMIMYLCQAVEQLQKKDEQILSTKPSDA